MYKIAVLASTNGTDFQAIIDEIEAGTLKNVEIVGLLTNRSKCGAVAKAEKAGIPVFTFKAKGKSRDSMTPHEERMDGGINPAPNTFRKKSREEFDSEMIKKLKELKADLIVLVGYMRILSDKFVQAFPGKIINVHPSLLPKFAGGMDCNVHEEVLKAGEKETGMTIHYVTEDLDGGKIICQKSCPVLPDDTPETLKKRVQDLEKKWYPKTIQDFADGKI